MTLTRDRLEYTKHCFQRLEELAGCGYDHYVFDQGSTDGTEKWLVEWSNDGRLGRRYVCMHGENIGINRALNRLLNGVLAPTHPSYDVVVKFDNDCEPLTNNILADVAETAHLSGAILAPTILGLNNPMPTISQNGRVRVTPMVGGIFMAVPAQVYQDGFRFNEANPLWGGDDSQICQWHRARGGQCGYLLDHQANHYKTTRGQWADIPHYFARTLAEGKPAL